MTTELDAKLKGGFTLSEAEFSRLKEIINDQIKKVNDGVDAKLEYELKFKNGAVSVFHSTKEIFELENAGSGAVTSLTIHAEATVKENGFIEVKFTGNGNDKDKAGSSYIISSNDKDWTFVTTSLIDERLKRIRTGEWLAMAINEETMSVVALVTMTLVFVFLMQQVKNGSDIADEIRKIYLSHKTTDELIYKISMANALKASQMTGPSWFIYFPILLFIPTFGARYLRKILPSTKFYWGDAINRYDRSASRIRFVLVGIVLAIAVGLFVNYLSARVL